MATWMEKMFGGMGTAGFFGGGQYQVDPNAYNIGQAEQMNAGMGEGGWQDAQRYNGLYNPMGQSQDARNQQMGVLGQQGQLAGNLFAGLNGSQPSVAQQQLAQTTQGNVANAFAMAQANPNNPAAARMAAMNAGNVNQQAAGQGALLRAQETQNTQGMLGGLLGNMQQGAGGIRGQDVGTYGTLQNTAQGYLGQQMQLQQMQQQAAAQRQQAQQTAFSGAQSNAVGGKILGAAGSIAGAAMGLAHGGQVPSVMGDRICAGCGHLNSECICGSRAHGGLIPGYAKGGDSKANDTVPAMLSPGEVVLPRSVTKAGDAPDKAKAFVEAIRKKHKLKRAA